MTAGNYRQATALLFFLLENRQNYLSESNNYTLTFVLVYVMHTEKKTMNELLLSIKKLVRLRQPKQRCYIFYHIVIYSKSYTI